MEEGTIPSYSGLWVMLLLIIFDSFFLGLGLQFTKSVLNAIQSSLYIQLSPLQYFAHEL